MVLDTVTVVRRICDEGTEMLHEDLPPVELSQLDQAKLDISCSASVEGLTELLMGIADGLGLRVNESRQVRLHSHGVVKLEIANKAREEEKKKMERGNKETDPKRLVAAAPIYIYIYIFFLI